MWLPLQLVLEFLGRSVTWLAVMAAFGAAAALLVTVAARRPARRAWPVLVLAGLIGAVAGASLAHRFGLPEACTFRIWRRSVPVAWSTGGALLGAAAAALLGGRFPSTTGGPFGRRGRVTPREAPEDSPPEDEARPKLGADRPPTGDRPEAPPE